MPHYHNFGWYYFAKYILGLAGMIFLYTGVFKEKPVVCVCPAEDRELARCKKRNNESSSTGDLTDVPARTNFNARKFSIVDVKDENVQTRIKPKRRSVDKNVATSEKDLGAKYRVGSCDSSRKKARSVSSSDGKSEINDGEERHSHNRRKCLHRRDRHDRKCKRRILSTNSKITACSDSETKKDETGSVINKVATGNFRTRNCFAEQENLELEAFVRSIVDKEVSKKLPAINLRDETSSNESSTSDKNRTTETRDRDSEVPKNLSKKMDAVPKCRNVYHGSSNPRCEKHHPRSPVTSFTSAHSRSGTLYFTASSRDKKISECKIHGRDFRNKIRHEYGIKKLYCSRIGDDSYNFNRDAKHLRVHVDRRKIPGRRVTRSGSNMAL